MQLQANRYVWSQNSETAVGLLTLGLRLPPSAANPPLTRRASSQYLSTHHAAIDVEQTMRYSRQLMRVSWVRNTPQQMPQQRLQRRCVAVS
jgi:hypothetical protein